MCQLRVWRRPKRRSNSHARIKIAGNKKRGIAPFFQSAEFRVQSSTVIRANGAGFFLCYSGVHTLLSSWGLTPGSRLWELSQRDTYRIYWIAAVALLPRDDKIYHPLSLRAIADGVAIQSIILSRSDSTPQDDTRVGSAPQDDKKESHGMTKEVQGPEKLLKTVSHRQTCKIKSTICFGEVAV